MSWYVQSGVAEDLADQLVTSWVARIEGTHQLIPDGCVDVLWIGNGTAWVCGPETSAWSFALPAGTEAVGVRFRTGRAAAVLDMNTAELVDRRVPLEDVLGCRAGRHLVEEIGEAVDPVGRSRALENHVRRWMAVAPAADPVVGAVSRLLTRDATTTVAALAEVTGLSERQLHRRCTRSFGYGPATLRRILRLQRFLRLARHPAAPRDLAALAVAAGYTDQPHLSHDCRVIAGTTPRLLIGR